MKVEFKAQIKQLTLKQLVSGDNGIRVTLDQSNLPADITAKLSALNTSELNKSGELKITISDES